MAKNDTKANEASPEEAAKRAKIMKAGIGIGVGSAAIVAALLYANHNKKKKPSTID
jgi:homoserine kinase